MSDCIFCKIVAGEIPSLKVYENEQVLAFLDVAPISKGHVLVIPKNHFANLEEIPENELCELIKAVKQVGATLKTGLGAPGYNLSVNNDPVAGQVITHLHFHLIPRQPNDGLELWPNINYDEGEAEKIQAKIKPD